MLHPKWIFIPSVLLLVACGNPGGPGTDARRAGTTGFTADEPGSEPGSGPESVTNGDAYAETQLAQLDPVADAKNTLKTKVRQFELSRFDAGQTKPSRFGAARWELTVYFQKARPLKVTGTFTGTGASRTLVPDRRDRRFTISDTLLTDSRQPFEKTDLRFQLNDTTKKESIRVSYKAYRANVDVRSDSDKQAVPGSVLACQIKSLSENTFGWANNWTVLNHGRVFYLYDLVRTSNPDQAAKECLPATISLRGESLATASKKPAKSGQAPVQTLYEHPVKSELGNDVRLIGNPEEGNKRMFLVPLEDKQSTETNNLIVTFAAQNPDPESGVDASETPDLPPELEMEPEDEPATAPGKVVDATPAPAAPKRNAPRPVAKADPAPTAAPSAPAPTRTTRTEVPRGQGFVTYPTDLPRSARIVRDFNRNRDVRGVWKWINAYKQGSRRRDFQTYVNAGWPLRGIIHAISRAWDSAAWEALAIVESEYLKGGVYQIQWGDGGKALGPFQLHVQAALEGKLKVGGTGDERGFFATSACGAAQYLAKRVDEFPNDATLAILAYNRGAGGASAAIYCSYSSERAGDRKQCAQQITGGFSKTEYGRFIKLSKSYRYTYREMATFGVLTPAMLDYVDHKLAAYFISMDFKHYGFTTDAVKRSLPTKTVFPDRGISDPRCRQAVESAPSA